MVHSVAQYNRFLCVAVDRGLLSTERGHYRGQVKGIIGGSTELSDLFLSGELKNTIATNNIKSVAVLVYVLFFLGYVAHFIRHLIVI